MIVCSGCGRWIFANPQSIAIHDGDLKEGLSEDYQLLGTYCSACIDRLVKYIVKRYPKKFRTVPPDPVEPDLGEWDYDPIKEKIL